MKGLKKRTMVLIQLLLMLCCMASTGEAANKTLRDTAVNIDTYAKVDDATSALTGLNSFYVDGIERGFQQWFWYRVGPSDAEKPLDLLPKKIASTQPTSTSLQTSYTLAGQFDISLLYELTPYPSGVGKASLKKTVTITNTSAAELDYHLFEYSDYDLSDADTILGDSDNIEVHNFKVYQNGAQADGSGITYIHESSLPPSSYDMDDGSMSLRDSLKDIDPTNFSIPQTPYGYASDRQFVKQWDLTIPAGQSVSFTITDSFYPTKPVTASVTSDKSPPACVTYGGQTSYTINFDNLLNTAAVTESLTNVKLIDFLPNGIAPATIPPTDGSVYDAAANTLTWDLPNLAPGAVQQTKSLTVTVNSTTDFTNEILLVSEQAFPTRVPLQDPLLDPIITNTLCNHPPSIADVKDVSVNEGSSFSVQAQAFPNDTGQALTYSLNGAPAGMSISATGLISYPVAVFGVHTVTVTVTDNGAGALTASDSFILTVNKLNKPPFINSSAPTTANITQPYTYTIIASDPDNDTLTYGLYTSPPGMTMVGNVISWTPLANQAALWPVRVFAKDGKGGEATQDFNINVSSVIKQTPTITWAVPAAITYNTALSATQLNASASVPGSFAYTPASGTILNAGNQNLSVVFTPTDTTNFNIATAAVTLTVNKAAATVTLSGLAATYDGTAKAATATTTPAGKTVAITYAGSTTAPTAAGTYAVVATVSDVNYSGSASGTLTINKATPSITWATPAAVYIGTPLSATQLNAAVSSGVAGSFAYTPVSGTLMNTAGNQTLSVTFSPTDTANYTSATASVVLAVNSKTTPVITWAAPTAITYGTALSATQLNASTNVPGTFVYTPAAGTVLNAGTQSLTVLFTPNDTAAYTTASATRSLTVNKAAATVSLGSLSQTYNGSAKSASAVTSPAGLNVSFTYAGSTTAPTAAGTYAVVATVSDANYSGSASGTLTINKATPSINWATPTAISTGTALTPSQLNATSSVPGSFVYTPTTGTVMNSAGNQTLSVTFTPTDTANYTSATASVVLAVNSKTTPVITWAAPAAITYGTALSATQLNATVGGVAGTFSYTPALGTVLNAGSQTLSVTFTPTNTTTYNSAAATVTLTVNKATATVALSGLTATYDGTAKTATATTTPPGKTVAITYAGSTTAPTAAGTYAVAATVSDANYSGSASGTLTINKATPSINWATPAAVYIGTPLSATQLNAAVSGSVAGSFAYTPVSGTLMNTAGNQTLSVTFTPTDTVNYTSATASVVLAVNSKTTPSISWATQAAIMYGTALSANQLNATVSGGVAGTFTYSPALGTVLNAGSQTLSVTFTPTNTTTYNSATATVTLTVNKAAATVALSGLTATYDGTAKAITATTTPAGKTVAITYAGSTTAPTAAGSYAVVATVNDANYSGSASGTLVIAKATPTISWAAPAAVYIGSTLSATQLNATANVNGSFVYTPAAGTTMNTSGNQTLSVTFSPTDTANYTSATASVVLAVNSKITPSISWATPAAITYGTALSATQLNASASVPGSFAYTPASGTILNAGNQNLSVVFTPTDTTNYNIATAAVTLTVNKAAATVTLSGLTATYDGTAKAVTATTTPAGKTVAITYAGNATAPTAAGSYAVVATVNDANYSGSASGTLVITKATPTISWATPAAVYIGTPLSATQLNATANVPGTFVYTPAAGTVLNAGAQSLTVVFTPTDAVSYNTASANVSLTVTPTAPAITPDGDVNGDGKVDISDALLALKMSIGLLQPTTFNLSHADVGPLKNFKPAPNGKIDIEDVIVLLLRAVGTIPTW